MGKNIANSANRQAVEDGIRLAGAEKGRNFIGRKGATTALHVTLSRALLGTRFAN